METEKIIVHTPGPWRILEIVPNADETKWFTAEELHEGIYSRTATERRFEIRSTIENMKNIFGSAEGGHVANMQISYGDCAGAGRLQALANAHLIAAAPDLLEACRLMLPFAGDELSDLYKTISRAIKKAEGR